MYGGMGRYPQAREQLKMELLVEEWGVYIYIYIYMKVRYNVYIYIYIYIWLPKLKTSHVKFKVDSKNLKYRMVT